MMSDDAIKTDMIPWDDLSDEKRRQFAGRLNTEFDAGLTVAEAEHYYGNPEAVKEDFGDLGRGVECPNCYTELVADDVPHLEETGECPYCGEVLLTDE